MGHLCLFSPSLRLWEDCGRGARGWGNYYELLSSGHDRLLHPWTLCSYDQSSFQQAAQTLLSGLLTTTKEVTWKDECTCVSVREKRGFLEFGVHMVKMHYLHIWNCQRIRYSLKKKKGMRRWPPEELSNTQARAEVHKNSTDQNK